MTWVRSLIGNRGFVTSVGFENVGSTRSTRALSGASTRVGAFVVDGAEPDDALLDPPLSLHAPTKSAPTNPTPTSLLAE
jgi:hypothetical protein